MYVFLVKLVARGLPSAIYLSCVIYGLLHWRPEAVAGFTQCAVHPKGSACSYTSILFMLLYSSDHHGSVLSKASERLHEKMTNFVSKNKAALIRQVQGCQEAKQIYQGVSLKEIGQLEQDLVFRDAGTKDLINFLRVHQDMTRESKLRLLIIYASVHPEKFESDKLSKLMELARLPQDDMNAVYNMRLLEDSTDNKKSSLGPFSLKFDVHKYMIGYEIVAFMI